MTERHQRQLDVFSFNEQIYKYIVVAIFCWILLIKIEFKRNGCQKKHFFFFRDLVTVKENEPEGSTLMIIFLIFSISLLLFGYHCP